MAREIDQAKMQIYTGSFSWCSDTLQENIKAKMPDYSPLDPKTWPVITSEVVGSRYKGYRLLPPYVAYERRLIDLYVEHNSDKEIVVVRSDGKVAKRSLFFHYFPFVYNHQGRARGYEYMHANHYSSWVFGVTGKLPETCTKGKIASSSVPETTTDASETSKDAFDEILEMLQDTQSESATGEME